MARPPPPSHYATLGLQEFSPELLKKQYRALALRWCVRQSHILPAEHVPFRLRGCSVWPRHPDRNRGNEDEAAEKFKEVHEAFAVLSNPAARAKYDRELAHSRRPASTARAASTERPPPAATEPQMTPRRTSAPRAPPAAPPAPAWVAPPATAASAPSPPSTSSAEAAAPSHRRDQDDNERAARDAATQRTPATTREPPRQSWRRSAEVVEEPETAVEEWPGLAAALAQSEREAQETARRDEQSAIADVQEAEREEAAEIAEALRLVELAMKRERDEFEEALRAVAVSESGIGVACNTLPSFESRTDEFGSLSNGGSSIGAGGGASGGPMNEEQQLAALMELGFHAEVAAPYCDGVSAIEDIVEQLSLLSPVDFPDDASGRHGRPSSSKPPRWRWRRSVNG